MRPTIKKTAAAMALLIAATAASLAGTVSPASATGNAINPGDVLVLAETSTDLTYNLRLVKADPITHGYHTITKNGDIDYAEAVASAANADVYVGAAEPLADHGKIVRVDHVTGNQSVIYQQADLWPDDLAVAADGTLWILGQLGDHTVLERLNPGLGVVMQTIPWSADPWAATTMVVESDGDLLLNDTQNDVIRFDPKTNTRTTVATFSAHVEHLALKQDGTIVADLGYQATTRLATQTGLGGVESTLTSGVFLYNGGGLARQADGHIVDVSGYDPAVVQVNATTGAQGRLALLDPWAFPHDLTVAGVSQIPPTPAAHTDYFQGIQDKILIGAAPGVRSNDTNVSSVQLVTPPQHGFLHLETNGSFDYDPASYFVGSDSFTYRPLSASGKPGAVATAWIYINSDNRPVAKQDSYSVQQDSGPSFFSAPEGVLANDYSPIDRAIWVDSANITQPVHGKVSMSPSGAFYYTPNPGYAGPDLFKYRDGDGLDPLSYWGIVSVIVKIKPVAGTPTVAVVKGGSVGGNGYNATEALLLSDSDTSTSALTVSATSSNTTLVPNANITFSGSGADRKVTVLRASGQSGTAVVTVTVSDGTHSSSVPITVKVDGDAAGTVVGTDGADLLFGRGGDDVLQGLGGNDILVGGAGKDTYTGGAGADVFHAVAGDGDVVTDFDAAQGDTTVS